MNASTLSFSHLVTGGIRVLLRGVWGPLCILLLRLRVWVWGAAAFEQAVFHAPPWLALAYLKAWGAQIGPEIDFHGRLLLHGAYHPAGKLIVGPRCHIGPGVSMDFSAPIVLGEGCTISLNAQLLTHHDTGYSPLRQLYPTYSAAVTLEDGVYIGAGAIIFPGVRVGQCAVIGAGSIVRETVPAYTVVAGVPARIIRQLDPPSKAIHE